MTDVILDNWQSAPQCEGGFVILPDGCRDIIVAERQGAAPQLVLSALAPCAQRARLNGFHRLSGYRLAPGTRVDLGRVQQELGQIAPGTSCLDAIRNVAVRESTLAEAIERLAQSAESVACVAADLGLRSRSLQRLFAREGLPAPVFWLQLARARRSAVAVLQDCPLADIACAEGYADQAHMSRAFTRFFGVSPKELRRTEALAEQITQSGLATGEQISTKLPSGSLTKDTVCPQGI